MTSTSTIDPPQLTLDLDDRPNWLTNDDEASLDAKFWRFHKGHPEVYRQLVGMSREAVGAGRDRLAIGMLFEVIRWHRVIEPDSTEEFKLNNNYRSRYARLIMEQEPDLDGVFATRELSTDSTLEPAEA